MATDPSSCSEYPRASFLLAVFDRRLSWFRVLGFAMVGVLAALGVPGSGAAREARPNSTKVIGLVTAVEPAQITILSGNGGEVKATTQEDFTQKVAVGSKVTAWYSVRDGANVLDWMEYPRENFFVPAEQIRTRISKVIILPSSEVPDADGLFDAIADYLESSFDWYVAPRVLAEENRDRVPSRPQDQAAGEQRLIRTLASKARVDAVLEADVVEVQAKLNRLVASWDGVEEPIAGKGSQTIAELAVISPRSVVPATTVVLKLWDSHGDLLWTNQSGFAALAVREGMGSK